MKKILPLMIGMILLAGCNGLLSRNNGETKPTPTYPAATNTTSITVEDYFAEPEIVELRMK